MHKRISDFVISRVLAFTLFLLLLTTLGSSSSPLR